MKPQRTIASFRLPPASGPTVGTFCIAAIPRPKHLLRQRSQVKQELLGQDGHRGSQVNAAALSEFYLVGGRWYAADHGDAPLLIMDLNTPRYRVFIFAAPLIAAGLFLIALMFPDGPGDHVSIGFLVATIFGQGTLASAWSAFGPGRLVWRLPLSLIWVSMIPVAFAINLARNHGRAYEALVVVGACILGQWFLVQIPLWALAIAYGVRLRHRDDAAGRGTDPRERQFGIRQLMIITAVVGVVFGIGRLLVTNLGPGFDPRGDAAATIFLAVAAIILTLPLVLAALLPRLAIPATVLTLLLIGLATAWEIPMLRRAATTSGFTTPHLIWTNIFTCAWILAIALVVRLNGYCLASPGSTSGAKN